METNGNIAIPGENNLDAQSEVLLLILKGFIQGSSQDFSMMG